MLLNYILKNGWDGELYGVCFITIQSNTIS